jgi:NADH-quinone oxidoreductase subunit A
MESKARERTAVLTLYGYIALFALMATAFALLSLALSALIRPNKPNPVKCETYECGIPAVGSSWIQFRPGFYLYALLFVILDVEAVFLFPWALIYRRSDLGLILLVEVVLFVAVLVLGLWYAWKKKALAWN